MRARKKTVLAPTMVKTYNQKGMKTDFQDETISPENDIALALENLHTKLTRLLGERIEKLALYGSRARGDYEAGSDVDVVIIVKNLDNELKERILNLVADIELEHMVPLSMLVLSDVTYKELFKRERRIALDIEREGIPL